MAFNIINRDFLVQSFDDYNMYALHDLTQVRVVDEPARYEASTDSDALLIIDDSSSIPGTGEVGISTVEAVTPGLFSVGDHVKYIEETFHYEDEISDKYIKTTKLPDYFRSYTEGEVNALFDGTSQEITYYKSLIADDKTSKFFIWSSSNTADKIAQGVIQANEYADMLLSSISQVKLKYVTVLPSAGEPNVIYILQPASSASKPTLNLFDEDKSEWIEIGKFEIDLTDYYTKVEMGLILKDYAKLSEVVLVDDIETVPIDFTKNPWA